MLVRLRILLAIALLGATAPLQAQICESGQSLQDCATEAFAMAQLASQVVARNAGENPELPGAATTINDFLSRMRASVDSGSLSGDDDEAMTFELNDFLGLPVNDGYKLQALLRRPKLFAKLAEEIPEDVRATRVAEIEKGLDDFDDVTLSFTYSPMTKSMGRKPMLHWEEQSRLFEGVKASNRDLVDKFFQDKDAWAQLIQDLPDEMQILIAEEGADSNAEEDADSKELVEKLGQPTVERLAKAMAQAAETSETLRVTIQDELQSSKFFLFADLVANQPQLYFNAEWTSPNELIGPRKLTGKATYEHGFVNVNSLRKACPHEVAKANETTEERNARFKRFSTCYQLYMTPERITTLKNGNRFSVSVEYSNVEDYNPALPDGSGSIDLQADRKWAGSVVLGRYLSFFQDGSGRSRVDLEWKHEDFGDDPNRKDRSVATLSFSQKIAGETAFTLGLVYANRPEFRGDVDKEVSARFGLNYRLLRKGEI